MAATSLEQPTQGLAAYRRVFAAPRVKPLLFAALLARLPIGMGAVGLILFIHGENGSLRTRRRAPAQRRRPGRRRPARPRGRRDRAADDRRRARRLWHAAGRRCPAPPLE